MSPNWLRFKSTYSSSEPRSHLQNNIQVFLEWVLIDLGSSQSIVRVSPDYTYKIIYRYFDGMSPKWLWFKSTYSWSEFIIHLQNSTQMFSWSKSIQIDFGSSQPKVQVSLDNTYKIIYICFPVMSPKWLRFELTYSLSESRLHLQNYIQIFFWSESK